MTLTLPPSDWGSLDLPGDGILRFRLVRHKTTPIHIQASNPLKFIPCRSPNTYISQAQAHAPASASDSALSSFSFSTSSTLFHPDQAAWLFLTNFGGGILHVDRFRIYIVAESHTTVVLLTQGSTKIYKRISSSTQSQLSQPASQSIHVHIHQHALLCLLPDHVVCFKNAHYLQNQTFHLQKNASLVFLDWISAGRIASGEVWQLHQYISNTRIYSQNRLILVDTLNLKQNSEPKHQHHRQIHPQQLPTSASNSSFSSSSSISHSRSLREKMHNFNLYATLVVLGPRTEALSNIIQQDPIVTAIHTTTIEGMTLGKKRGDSTGPKTEGTTSIGTSTGTGSRSEAGASQHQRCLASLSHVPHGIVVKIASDSLSIVQKLLSRWFDQGLTSTLGRNPWSNKNLI